MKGRDLTLFVGSALMKGRKIIRKEKINVLLKKMPPSTSAMRVYYSQTFK
jgi:hypothetical protein